MASAASVTASTTNSSTTLLNSNPPQNNNGLGRTTMRPTTNAKTGDAGRKQSPVDGASRRPTAQKPWGPGPNSGSQRASMPVQQNGNTPQPRNAGNTKQNTQKEAGISDKQANERLIFILGAAIGLNVVVTAKSGEKYEGLLSGSNLNAPSYKVTLKMVKKVQSAQVNGTTSREAAFAGTSPEHAMNFDLRDVSDFQISEFILTESSKLANGSSSSFQTDADISGNQARGERTLQKWVPEGPDNTELSLESGGAGTWDQFATNSQLFGAQSTYDESLYTTAIDRSAPSYKRREAEAARIAREIEGQTSGNAHVREERGQAVEHDGEDEEDKYSGVRRDERTFPPLPVGGPNKYTPPARRAPTGQATVPGAPVDPAIISAQMAPPKPRQANKTTNDVETPSALSTEAPTPTQHGGSTASVSTSPSKETLAPSTEPETEADPASADLTNKLGVQGPTENVEVKVLNQFRQFADLEKQRVIERRKAQANQDRTAKLNELLRFSKSFKLKTPIPSDLIGILAKDPAKQEAIVEKAQKEHTESSVPTTTTAPVAAVTANPRKPDAPQSQPVIPDRQVFNRGRGGYPPNGRPDRAGSQQQSQPPLFPSRNGSGAYPSRFPHQPAGKGIPPHQIPAPIPIIDGRIPPAGPMADQSGLSSPQRSNMHTPASTISGKFNLNVKASEFRPNAAATTFNPTSSQPPSSPSSTQRGASISRTASPSAFFGNRKPKPASERLSVTKDFNPIARMRRELTAAKPDEPTKDYSNNGGIPNAFQTGPRWTVKDENDQKTYEEAFERPAVPVVSPSQSRSASTHHVPYPGQGVSLPNGPAVIPHISTPQHGPHAVAHQYPHQYDDGSHRMQFGNATPNIYPSPNMASRQASTYASPMNHPAQLAYQQQQQQQPYFGTPGAQLPMRAYPGTPGMMHAQVGQMTAPMMIQQQSNGPYMAVPSQFGHQVPMYSPSPAHVYPQQNGYSSPQRMAPIMMHQGSQQGHPAAPGMMYSMSGQGGPMVYPQQQAGMTRGNYGGHQYGNAPGYAMQHRTMSSGYPQIPQKGYPQHMQANHGPTMNGPPQGPAYTQLEGTQDEGK